jgi:multidrug efflux pump subunit AcrB
MVYKTSGTDILDLVKRLKDFLKTKESYFKQQNLQKVDIFTRTDEVNKTFRTFTSNFRQTALIILVVIALFIGLKEAVGVFFAFPLVYLITFIYLKAV